MNNMNILLNDAEYDVKDLVSTEDTDEETVTEQHFIGKPMNLFGKQVDSYVVICDTISLIVFGLMIRYFVKELMYKINELRYEIMLSRERKTEQKRMKDEIKYVQGLLKIKKKKKKKKKRSERERKRLAKKTAKAKTKNDEISTVPFQEPY